MSITAVVMKILRTNNMFNKIAEMFIKYCKHFSYHKEFPIIFCPEAFTYLKSTLETPKRRVKYAQSWK